MKVKDIENEYDNYNSVVKITDFEHFFNVYVDDKNDRYKFNLNSTLYIDASEVSITQLVSDMYWTTISYTLYGTPHLAWLLMKINGISARNVFRIIPAGTNIRYIPYEQVRSLLKTIY